MFLSGLCPISSAQSFMSKPYRTRWRSYSASMKRTNTATSGGQIRQVLVLVLGFVHRGNFGTVCTHWNVSRTNQASPVFSSAIDHVHKATCCAACTNSDDRRTNLFLVRGLVIIIGGLRCSVPSCHYIKVLKVNNKGKCGSIWLNAHVHCP